MLGYTIFVYSVPGHRFLGRFWKAAMGSKTIYTQAYRELVHQLRSRREAMGLTQTEVASLVGWPQQRLSAVEAGARRLDVVEFIELTTQLGLAASSLVEDLGRALGVSKSKQD